MTNRATPRFATRCCRSFNRQRFNNTRIASDTSSGSTLQSGSARSTAASVSEASSPSNARLAGEHFVEDAPKRPHVGTLIGTASLRLLRRHVRGGAENDAGLVAPIVSVGELPTSGDDGSDDSGFGQTEVEHLDSIVWSQRDVRGLQIAMNDAAIVGGFERFADLLRDGEAF